MDFALIQEGLALVSRLDESSDTFMADLSRLREIIGAAPPEDKPVMEIDVSSKKAAEDGFLRYLQDFEKIPEHLRGVEYSMALTIVGGRVLSNGLSKEQKDAILPIPDRYGEKAVEIYKGFKEKGFSLPSEERNDVYSVEETIKALRNTKPNDFEEVKRLKQKANELQQNVINADFGTPEYVKAYEEYDQASELVYSVTDKFYAEINKRTSEEKSVIDKIGMKMINGLLEKSSITEQQSLEWAEKQMVSPSAMAKLKKSGYKKELLIKDMAEFYRITGGKAYSFSLETVRSKRSSASGGSSQAGEARTILIGSGFSRKTLWHEMAHHVEGDKVAFFAASGFLASRRKSEKPVRLLSLVPGSGYGSNEVAFPDEFIDAYIGKAYAHEATEVFSMGIQYLSDPYDAAMLAAKDPEMFALITGYLSTPLTVAAKAKLVAHEGISTSKAESLGEIKDAYPTAIEKLSSTTVFTEETEYTGDNETVKYLIQISYNYIGYAVTKGGSRFNLFSSKVHNYATGRRSKGFAFKEESSLDGSFRTMAGSLGDMLAMLAMEYITGTGAAYRIFNSKMDAAAMKQVIDAAEMVK